MMEMSINSYRDHGYVSSMVWPASNDCCAIKPDITAFIQFYAEKCLYYILNCNLVLENGWRMHSILFQGLFLNDILYTENWHCMF